MIRKILLGLYILLPAFSLNAETPSLKDGIRIEGRKTAIVNQANIRLSDIAEVSSRSMQDDEAIIALQKIRIDPAPRVGEEVTVSASRILERLKEEGVKLSEIVYVLPRIVSVSRASRVLSMPEIEEALKQALKDNGKEMNIKQINYNDSIKVPPSYSHIKANIYQSSHPGEISFNITGSVDGEEDQKFDLTAQVDQWINVPVAGSYLTKGNKIASGDIVMARMNAANIPMDVFHNTEEIIGKEVTSDIQYGESFRKNKLNIPAAVLNGSKVVLYYKSGALEATATGIAQEAGLIGQEIKVKNESSKKIVVGKVIEPGKVGVNP
jgi:flagella basal body P-ring formation protein FlgA